MQQAHLNFKLPLAVMSKDTKWLLTHTHTRSTVHKTHSQPNTSSQRLVHMRTRVHVYMQLRVFVANKIHPGKTSSEKLSSEIQHKPNRFQRSHESQEPVWTILCSYSPHSVRPALRAALAVPNHVNCTKDGDSDLNTQDSPTAQVHGQLRPGGREEVSSCCKHHRGRMRCAHSGCAWGRSR